MKRILPIFLLLFILPVCLQATVSVSSILSSNMVLQQNSQIRLWGRATPNEIVRVRCSWLGYIEVTEPDPAGRWMVTVPSRAAGGPYSITIYGENTITLTNIMFGEVWVCSGQSNMEYTINMLGGYKYYKELEKNLSTTDYSQIRICQIRKATAEKPVDTCTAAWACADEKTIEDFSATAFFFGMELYTKLHVPIGLISSNWGGTPAEAWTEKGYLGQDPDLGYFLHAPNAGHWIAAQPSVLVNGMIHPILNFTIRGVIWYQGEANIHDADLYERLFIALIHNWRDAWGRGDFPFYYVQIAPFNYGETYDAAAFLRDAQFRCLSEKYTGMVVTNDIGSVTDIHPKNKQEVGRRLALWALTNTYNVTDMEFSGPLYLKMRNEGNAIRIYFTHSGTGLVAREPKITGFTVCGADHRFFPADALIADSTILVSSAQVDHPVNVRYAFTDTAMASLYNKAGLPASPFRTDTLPVFIRKVRIGIQADSLHNGAVVDLTCPDDHAGIHYTLDGTDPLYSSSIFEGKFRIDSSCLIKARAFKGQTASPLTLQTRFIKHLGFGKKITLVQPFSGKYTGGENALLDGTFGSLDFLDGHWQGYQRVDFEGVIDLGREIPVESVAISFLQQPASWIFLPLSVEFSTSTDGHIYQTACSQKTAESPKETQGFVKEFRCTVPTGQHLSDQTDTKEIKKSRYIRITAKNRGICPAWHPGHGQPAWMFVDEIVIH
jgi:sialate O-acetylesterase